MTISLITSGLTANRALLRTMSLDAWAADWEMRGEKVAKFRRYTDGDHDATMTEEMRKMLRIVSGGSAGRFNDNYMPIVIETKADRLQVDRLETDTNEGNTWVSDLLFANRFDGLQARATKAAIRDGDTYAHVYWDNATRQARLSHEPAYDGTNGLLVIHNELGRTQPDIAIKIWTVTLDALNDTTYLNLYYPDRIEKYVSTNGGALAPREIPGEVWPAPWEFQGRPLGVPFVHFRNMATDYDNFGRSEIEDAIPIQDALNRTMYSMVMTAELSAFPILVARGFQPPANIAPGAMITIGAGGLTSDQVADLTRIPASDTMPYIAQAQWLTGEIGRITRTPSPEFGSNDNASGEALKQREIGLIGKVKQFQVDAGNAWEDLIMLAEKVQRAFGVQPPPAFSRVDCQWKDPEIRNDAVLVQNVMAVTDKIGRRETIRQLAPVFGWNDTKIDELVEEVDTEASRALATLVAQMPTFTNAQLGLTPAQPAPEGGNRASAQGVG